MSHTNKIPFSKAILYIIFSIFLFSGMPYLIWNHLNIRQKNRCLNPEFNIRCLMQTGPVKEAIKPAHLEELLQLSVDEPKNLFAYNLKEGEKLLLESFVVKEAKLSIQPPDTLVVDYIAREPIAYISDYSNLVIDEFGSLFPLSPYYTPKVLPEIYLGIKIEPFSYGLIQDEKWSFAKEILQYFKELGVKGLAIKKIDVSRVKASSIGKNEIIVTLYEELGQKKYVRYLRLSKEKYIEEIEHYLSLKQMSLADDLVVDLRLLPNAYLTPLRELNTL